MPEADIVAVSFQTFLRLPELQRCAVILKDVLGHSVDEIASIADCYAGGRQIGASTRPHGAAATRADARRTPGCR